MYKLGNKNNICRSGIAVVPAMVLLLLMTGCSSNKVKTQGPGESSFAGENAITRITSTLAEERFPDISSDGQQLLYQARKNRKSPWRIEKIRIAKAGIGLMSGDGASHPTWDADNHGMLYRDEEKKMLVHTKDFGVSRSALVSHPGVSDLMFPDATPDGAKVIFSSMVKGESTISMVNKNGSNLTVFSKGYMPSWHPNGEDVVFQDQADNDHTQIFILSTRTGQVTQVTNHPSNNMQPTWSPDGQWIAFNSDRSESEFGSRQKAPHLYAIQPNGTNMVQLTKGTAVSLSRPTWSSTGDIYFVSTSGSNYSIMAGNP